MNFTPKLIVFPLRTLGAWLVLVMLTWPSVGASSPMNTPPKTDFSAFKIIPERNIFIPNRTPGSRANAEPPPPPRVRGAKVEAFVLVGTISYEKGQFAFFDGSASNYKQALAVGGTIAGYTVTEIAPSKVKLQSTNAELEVSIGMQLRREDEGEWKLTGKSEIPLTTSDATAGTSTNAPNTAASSSEDSLLERLRKKREAELNK